MAGTKITAAEVTGDVTTLKSDDDRRDGQLRRQALETDQFPQATFKLTTPIELGSVPADGQPLSATATGELTLHGVTKTVDIPAQAQLNGSLIQVVGSLSFPFSDYQINAPNIGGFVSVQDQGTLEFQVNLAKG